MSDNQNTEAAEYVMGLMDAETRAAFEARLAGDLALQTEVALWQEEFASLDNEYEPVVPGEDLWPAISDRLTQLEGPDSANDNGPAGISRWWKMAAFANGAIAAALVLVLILRPPEIQREYMGPSEEPAMVAQLQGDIDGLLLTASYNPRSGFMKIDVDGMPETDTEPEVWVQKADNSVISLGQIQRDGLSGMSVPEGTSEHLTEGAVLILTMEPPSREPHEAPSGDAVATGKMVFIS